MKIKDKEKFINDYNKRKKVILIEECLILVWDVRRLLSNVKNKEILKRGRGKIDYLKRDDN